MSDLLKLCKKKPNFVAHKRVKWQSVKFSSVAITFEASRIIHVQNVSTIPRSSADVISSSTTSPADQHCEPLISVVVSLHADRRSTCARHWLPQYACVEVNSTHAYKLLPRQHAKISLRMRIRS